MLWLRSAGHWSGSLSDHGGRHDRIPYAMELAGQRRRSALGWANCNVPRDRHCYPVGLLNSPAHAVLQRQARAVSNNSHALAASDLRHCEHGRPARRSLGVGISLGVRYRFVNLYEAYTLYNFLMYLMLLLDRAGD